MLHIIGLIFQIIGIILLVILCLLLAMLLTVLLVPIRYKVRAEHGENLLEAEGRVSWLLHLVEAKASHLEGVFHIRVRVLWFIIYDNLKPKTPKTPKVRKMRKKEKNAKAGTGKEDQIKKEDETEKQDQAEKEIKTENKADAVLDGNTIKEGMYTEEAADNGKLPADANHGSEAAVIDKIPDHTESGQENSRQQEAEDDRVPFLGKIFDKLKNIMNRFLAGIKNILNKIKSRKDRVIAACQRIKSKITGWLETASNMKRRLNLISAFIKDEVNRGGFKVTYAGLRRLLKHILPTKLRSSIVFGTGDPCSTGQALGAMSVLYSFYGDKLRIIPDFENKRFEGRHYARGRIRLATILIIVVKLISDKHFSGLRKNLIILKEAL